MGSFRGAVGALGVAVVVLLGGCGDSGSGSPAELQPGMAASGSRTALLAVGDCVTAEGCGAEQLRLGDDATLRLMLPTETPLTLLSIPAVALPTSVRDGLWVIEFTKVAAGTYLLTAITADGSQWQLVVVKA